MVKVCHAMSCQPHDTTPPQLHDIDYFPRTCPVVFYAILKCVIFCCLSRNDTSLLESHKDSVLSGSLTRQATVLWLNSTGVLGCESLSLMVNVSDPVSVCTVEKGSTEEYYVTSVVLKVLFHRALWAGQDHGCA